MHADTRGRGERCESGPFDFALADARAALRANGLGRAGERSQERANGLEGAGERSQERANGVRCERDDKGQAPGSQPRGPATQSGATAKIFADPSPPARAVLWLSAWPKVARLAMWWRFSLLA